MDWKLLLLSVALPIVAAIGGVKLVQAKRLARELGEAVVATGLLLIESTKALDDNKLSNEERKTIAEHSKTVAREYKDVIAAAVALVQRK
jgi:hypothetical protein